VPIHRVKKYNKKLLVHLNLSDEKSRNNTHMHTDVQSLLFKYVCMQVPNVSDCLFCAVCREVRCVEVRTYKIGLILSHPSDCEW
jgi:hypothetical protein